MTLSVLDAIKLVKDGNAYEHIGRFIGVVKFSAASGSPACFDFDDALVAAMVLSRLTESAEGRKLLGLPKRKNTQYKARDFSMNTAQSRIADDYLAGKIDRNTATEALSVSLNSSPDLRTAARLLDDLAKRNSSVRSAMEAELAVDGANSDVPGAREGALIRALQRIGGPEWIEKILSGIESTSDPEAQKAAVRIELEKLLRGKATEA